MKTKSRIKTMTTIAVSTAIICLLGPHAIPIPFSPAPVALCMFGIYIAAYALGAKLAVAATGIYLLLGLAGVPVFSTTAGVGPGAFAGATGGYLIGYLPLAFFSGLFIEKFEKKYYMHVVGIVIGLAICYALGAPWLAHVVNYENFWVGLLNGVLVFLPGDALKIVLAMVVGIPLRRALKRI